MGNVGLCIVAELGQEKNLHGRRVVNDRAVRYGGGAVLAARRSPGLAGIVGHIR